jgi:large subunit ribosomal protein L3
MMNLEIIKADEENNLIYLKGSIPGSKNATVLVKESVKDVKRKTMVEKYQEKVKKAELAKGKKK